MPITKAAPSLSEDFANVVSLPPEARSIGAVSKGAIIAKAEQAIEFHENVAAYHTREAGKIRQTIKHLQKGSS